MGASATAGRARQGPTDFPGLISTIAILAVGVAVYRRQAPRAAEYL